MVRSDLTHVMCAKDLKAPSTREAGPFLRGRCMVGRV